MVVNSNLAERNVTLIQQIGNLKLQFIAAQHTATFNIANDFIDDVRHQSPELSYQIPFSLLKAILVHLLGPVDNTTLPHRN